MRTLIRMIRLASQHHGRTHRLVPADRHGHTYVIREGEEQRGCLAMRTLEAQLAGPWQADLQSPEDWSVPLAAFVGWLAREGRSGMGS